MKKVLVIIMISFLVLGLNYLGFLNWAKGGMSRIMGWRSNLYSSIINEQEEINEDQLAECKANLISLEEEIKQSRRLLGASTKPETKFELAKISSVGSDELVLILESSNLIENSASVVSGPFLVGKIVEVYGRNGKTKLLTSPETKIPVKIWSDQNVTQNTEIIGEGILTSDGRNLYVDEILESQSVEQGNWVGEVIESGDIFWIGKVEEVFPSEDKIFQQAKINWAVDLSKIITVGVIKND